MYCLKCGAQLPDDAAFCYRCGTKVSPAASQPQQPTAAGKTDAGSDARTVLADAGVTELKCPGCGAPIKPQFGEMVVTCEYCGSSVSLGSGGWRGVEKHTMLPLKLATKEQAFEYIRSIMDRGLLRKHLEEDSVNEEMALSVVPYWIVPVSARTSYTAVDAAAEVGSIATTAALFGLMGGAFGGGGRNSGFGTGMMEGAMFGGMAMGGFGGGRNTLRSYSLDQNYQFPVVAMKALNEYQPRDYQFSLQDRTLFSTSAIPKFAKILNGDVGEDSAKNSAKTGVDQVQSERVHRQHHMVQKMETQMDVSDPELLHVPVWFARFSHKGKKIVIVLDGNSGGVINSIGLD
jgi:DNA-directed RNA polymerase subunit RPC12/RpoP